MHISVFKASPRRQGGGGSPCLRSRLSPPRRRLGDKAVVDRLASPYRFKNIDAYLLHINLLLMHLWWVKTDNIMSDCIGPSCSICFTNSLLGKWSFGKLVSTASFQGFF